jgi:hypothetical protein
VARCAVGATTLDATPSLPTFVAIGATLGPSGFTRELWLAGSDDPIANAIHLVSAAAIGIDAYGKATV